MKNKHLFKIFLTILTIATITFLPIWVCPEVIVGKKSGLFIEWFFGLIKLIGIIIIGYFIYLLFSSIYELWDELID
jgi:hypothetical protein